MIEIDLPETEFHPDTVIHRRLVCNLRGVRKECVGNGRNGDRVSVAASLVPSDLDGCDRLSFRACNRSPSLALVEVVLTGMSEEGQRFQLFSGGREMLPSGQEREMVFPRESFGFYGGNGDWRHVSRLLIVLKRERGDVCGVPMDVAVSPVYGERRRIPPGPRLTDQGLSGRLSGQAAEALFPKTETNRSALSMPPPYGHPEERADEIMAGAIMGQRIPVPLTWDFSPDGAHEWTHFLNRHHFLRPLLRAFVERGDRKYAVFMGSVISDWIRKHPVPVGSNGGAGPAWETLSVAWRVREWLPVLKALWNVPAFGERTGTQVLRSLWEHCRHLMDHRGHPNNWIILESSALALAGMELPVFTESTLWRKEGISRLEKEIGRQFMDDGVHFEYSPLYHALCLHALLEVKRAARRLGIGLPSSFDAPVEKAADFLGAICRPDFTWPSVNDAGGAASDYSSVMRLAGEIFGRNDFVWLGTRGARGEPPRKKTLVFRSAGIGVLRSGWGKASHALISRAGPPGASHVHEDVLSFDISISGTPCLVDPGITAYAPGPRSRWYRSASAHNMVLVDGKGPLRKALPYGKRIESIRAAVRLSDTMSGPAIRGICDAYRGGDGSKITVARRAALVDGDRWIVTDRVTGSGAHLVTVSWQFFPGKVRYDRTAHAASYEGEDGGGCTLALLASGCKPKVVRSRGRSRPAAGWVSIRGRDVPADHLAFSFSASLPFTVTWEIRPNGSDSGNE